MVFVITLKIKQRSKVSSKTSIFFFCSKALQSKIYHYSVSRFICCLGHSVQFNQQWQLIAAVKTINFGTRSTRNLAFTLPLIHQRAQKKKPARALVHFVSERHDGASGNTARIRARHGRPIRGPRLEYLMVRLGDHIHGLLLHILCPPLPPCHE